MLGMKRIEQASSRWRKAYGKNGLIGLTDTRERQAERIELLEGQVEMLKKLEVKERRLLNDSQKLSSNKVFQLIFDTLTQFPFKRIVTYFCELLNVSRSGFYSFF